MKNVGNSWMQKKKIGGPPSMIYYKAKIPQKENCQQAI